MTSISANELPLRQCVRVEAWECVRSCLHYIWRTARIPRITLCPHTRPSCVIVKIRHAQVRWAFTIARNFVCSHSLTPFVDTGTIYTPSESHRIPPEKRNLFFFFVPFNNNNIPMGCWSGNTASENKVRKRESFRSLDLFCMCQYGVNTKQLAYARRILNNNE